MTGIPRQPTGLWDVDHVVRHDLRPPDAVRTFVDDQLWDQPGNRALVIVHGGDLENMRETLFDIAAARRMAVLCIVIGEPADGSTHPALILPGVLGSSGVGTLWVSDPQGQGCGWWIDSAQPMTSAEAVLRQSDRSALDLLDDCLQIPDVFDDVLGELEHMADHVANPGVLAFGGRPAVADLLAARLRAVRTVVGDGGPDPVRPESGFDGILPRGARLAQPSELDALLVPGLELFRTRQAAREAAADAAQVSAGAAIRLLGPGGSSWHAGARVGHARLLAQQFHRVVGRLLNGGHHPGEGLDEATREQIRGYGVAVESLRPMPGETLVAELRATTERCLRSSSLESVQTRLRLLADAATPRGSGDYLRELSGVGTDFAPLPQFPMRPAPAWLLALLGVAAFGAGLAGPPGLAVGVVALLGVLLVLARRPTQDATSGLGASATVLLAAHLPVAAAGLAGGLFVGTRLGVPPAIGAAVAVAAALVVVAGLLWWWSSAARRWLDLMDTDGPRRVVHALDALIYRVIVDEWRNASARAQLADAAVTVAVSLEQISTVLQAQGAALAAVQRPDQVAFDTVADPGLDALLEGDLRDAVEASLAGVWGRGRNSSPSGAWEAAGLQMAQHMEEYERHLAVQDLNEPPPFARSGRSRARAYGNWGPTRQLADLLDTPADGPLVQLCRTRHTNLFSLSRIRVVRFAPASMRDDVTDELAHRGRSPLLSELRWAGSGSLAGLLRLVAPRTGVVEMAWNHTGPGLGWSAEEDRDG